ncbi:MAG: hypothetical protein FK731_10210 [Asgard group archaeon]|nr:hypothetical protein [Asgard group archaeon]
MKRNIWRNKKGQIQGVDFALAMVIFMIMFAEIIVLTLTFIEPKYQNLENRAFESRAQQVEDVFFSSAGYPVDWEYNYGSEFNSIGLRKIASTQLDANKISRINPDSFYNIPYEQLKANLSKEIEIGFQLTITSLFDVSCSLILSQPTGSIDLTTSIGDCVIWVFIVAPNGSVIFTQRTSTNGLGELSLIFPTGAGVLPNGVYTLVVFAQSLEGLFAINYTDEIIGTETNLGLELLIQEEQNNNGQASIQTINDGSLTSLYATVLYPYQIGEELMGNDTTIITSPSSNENFNLRIPTNGTCVTLLTGVSATSFSRKTYFFPALLDEDFGTLFGYGIIPENKEAVRFEKLVTIRECIFKAVLYVWPE